MSSKYANLPDVDTTSPDVYETPDVPASYSFGHDSDSDSDEQQNHGLSTSGSGSNLLKAASRLSNGKNAANTAGEEAIQVDRLNLQDARKVFLDSNVNGRSADFSPSLVNSRRNRYPASLLPESSSYSIRQAPARGLSSTTRRQLRRDAESQITVTGYQEEPETPTEKLRRLRYEMEELETELEQQAQAQKETEGDVEEEEATVQNEEDELPRRDDADKTRPKGLARRKKKIPQVNEKGELSPAVLLSQLKRLRGDLGGLQDGHANSGIATNDQDEEEIAGIERAEKRSALLKRLYDQTTLGSRQDSASDGEASNIKADSASSSRIDERLEQLEKYVGSNEAPLDETHPLAPPLLTTLAKLEHQMHLLTQPRHLDTISRRVKLLVNDLERVHEARRKIGDNRPLNVALSSGITVSTGPSSAAALSGGTAAGEPALPPDAVQKIDALFTILPRIDPLIPLTPHLLTRLRSLSTLHASSSSFHKDLQDTQESIEGLKRSEEFLKELLGGLEQSLESNQQVVKNNLESIQGRIDAVMQRLDKLS